MKMIQHVNASEKKAGVTVTNKVNLIIPYGNGYLEKG